MDKVEELLTRGVANIIPNIGALEKALDSGKKLNVYLGIDPTATQIHLGHAVPLRKLKELSGLGHNVTFLIGDFTALIGDTSDKDSERPVITKKQIEENFKTYKEQAGKIVDFSKVKVKHNSQWLKKLDFEEIIKLCQHFSFGDFAGRELVRKRLGSGSKVNLHEALYPVMQGYDSYFMDTDLQLGGTDQTFNMQAGRTLQKDLRNKESFIMANVFLTGTDGRKMSKSWGNAIWLTDSPEEMFGKVMSLSDDLIVEYFTLATNAPTQRIDEIEKKLNSGENPMVLKKELANIIVSELHSKEAAQKVQKDFESVFQKGETPKNILEIKSDKPSINILDFLVKNSFTASRSQAKRLLKEGALELEGQTIRNEKIELSSSQILKIGKKKFIKIIVSSR